jgi:hypothetical protein
MTGSKCLITGATVLALLVFAAGIAGATLTPIGDPSEWGSWSQRFEESGVGTFDTMAIYWISGALGNGFQTPDFRNFSATTPPWANVVMSTPATLGKAVGPGSTSLQFDIAFMGAKSSPFAFDFVAWNGSTKKEQAGANWSGSAWTIGGASKTYGAPPEVPEPASCCLLALAVGGIGLGLKKRKKA